MTINYTVALRNKGGLAYDVIFQGKHLNLTIRNGLIEECVTIVDGVHSPTDIGTQADLCQYMLSTRH